MKKIVWLIFLAVFCSGATIYQVIGQTSRTDQEIKSDPKNIREIFLTVPWPKAEKDSVTGQAIEKVGDFDHRRMLVDKIEPGKGNSVIDHANGYLRIDLDQSLYVVMTYFQKSGGERLVVLQIADSNTPNLNPITDNYLFTLDHGNYTPELLTAYLPKITLTDFWGTQPLPRPALRKMIDNSFYIEWPRKGTIVSISFDEPDFDVDSPETIELEKNMKKRQFDRMELAWDKQSGTFIKGRKTKDKK